MFARGENEGGGGAQGDAEPTLDAGDGADKGGVEIAVVAVAVGAEECVMGRDLVTGGKKDADRDEIGGVSLP